MFKKNFEEICIQKGLSPTVVCEKIGLTGSAYSKWTDESMPRKTTLMKLATYLNVPIEDLTADTPPKLPEEPEQTLIALEANSTYMVPLYENVSAGFGALAVDSIVDHIPLYFKTRSEAERTICIRVRGDSMSPKIEDGDIVQVRKQETVDSGSLAVVLIDGEEGQIKYVTYEQEAIELRSVNPKYKPLRFIGQETLRIKVVGLVKLILKSATGKPEQVYPITDSEEKTKLLKLINTLDDDSLKELERYLSYLSSRPPRS